MHLIVPNINCELEVELELLPSAELSILLNYVLNWRCYDMPTAFDVPGTSVVFLLSLWI